MRIAFVSVLLILLMGIGCKTTKEISDLPWKQRLKIADRLYSSGSYYNALNFYTDLYKEQSTNSYLVSQLAITYRATRDYKSAEFWYKTLIELDKDNNKYPLANYDYALMLKMNGKYNMAKQVFTDFGKKYKGRDPSTFKKLVKNQVKGCEFAIKAIEHPKSAIVKHLNTEVNAAYHDFAPLPVGDSVLIFSSLRSDTVIVPGNKRSDQPMTKFYMVEKRGAKLVNRQPLPLPVDDEKHHNGNGTFSPDGNRFYFTRCDEVKYDKIVCSIFVTEKKADGWTSPSKLGNNVNIPGFTSTQPNIVSYMKGSEVLYFVSNKPGGEGGLDLWYSVITKRGVHKEAVNLGRKINTAGDEVTPHYDPTSQSIYFSSDGRIGMGGLDIYKSEGMLRRWSNIENMGYPLNSRVDDRGFVLDENGLGGYFVSNRPGVVALKSETCCDDIFSFKWENIIIVAVQGYVFELGDTTQTPIDGATVSLYLQDSETKEDIYITAENTAGGDMYFYKLNKERDYKLTASKEGFFSGKGLFTDFVTVTTKGITKSDTLRADLYLNRMDTGVGYVLKNIYYDFDKATLRGVSENTLDSLMIILNDHPAIKVEIGSHTDIRGSDEYNIKLSQKRAESVVRYLIKNGILKERLVAKGYGETALLEDCSKYEECPDENDATRDCPCHQRNRRTEFKILGEIENLRYIPAGKEGY